MDKKFSKVKRFQKSFPVVKKRKKKRKEKKERERFKNRISMSEKY